MGFLKRIGLVLATGYIAFFINERIFWSFPRAEDKLPELIMGWILYSVFAYVCLAAIESFKVRSIWSIFIVAGLFGWLIEGLYALTTFGINFPFPISISWTALAWHAPAFLLGWYLMLRALATSTTKTLLAAVGLGVFWGTWALAWPVNGDDSHVIGSDIFLMNGLICTTFYILALNSYRLLDIKSFVTTKAEKIVLALLMLALYAAYTVPAGGFLLPLTLLPALFGIVYFALRKNLSVETEANAFTLAGEKFPVWRLLLLLITPVVAALIFNSGFYMNTNIFYALVLTPLGTAMFILSFYKVMRSTQKAPVMDVPAPPMDVPMPPSEARA